MLSVPKSRSFSPIRFIQYKSKPTTPFVHHLPDNGGLPLIARNEPQTECEQLLSLLAGYEKERCICGVLKDITQIRRLLALYSFRTPYPAERLADQLTEHYRPEILAVYGTTPYFPKRTDSGYLRLEQLLSALLRVALMRLSRAGVLPLSRSQIAQSDGLLLLTLKDMHR